MLREPQAVKLITRRRDDRRVHDRALAKARVLGLQVSIDFLEQHLAEPVRLQEVPEIEDGVSSGSRSDSRSPANRRIDSISYSASSIPGSLRL